MTDREADRDDGLLLDRLETAQASRPLGLLLVGWEFPAGTATDVDYSRQIERSVAFGLAACVGRDDVVVAASATTLAVVVAPLTRPAATEGLAHRVAQRLDIELDRLATEYRRPPSRWAIGLVVDRPGDEPVDLVKYAGRALDDAWLLGARQIVAFDDGRR